tara:strand:- start:4706 stop:5239 length:534 start_codon:yes stop_codon:yes gene_type:complete
MIWLILSAVVFAAVLLWFLIETRGTLHLLWVIPITIGLITGTYQWSLSYFGYPTDIYEEGQEFVLLSYFVPNDEEKIVIWVILEGEDLPKSIIIPYNPDEEQGLQKVTDQMAEGGRFMGEFGSPPVGNEGTEKGEQGESGGGTLKSSAGMLSFKLLSVESFLPSKDYIERENANVRQ